MLFWPLKEGSLTFYQDLLHLLLVGSNFLDNENGILKGVHQIYLYRRGGFSYH